MTDQLRILAEAKSQIAFPVPELHMLKEIRKERRIGYVEGFIAGRTSVTHADIERVILGRTATAGARAVLALLNGENDD